MSKFKIIWNFNIIKKRTIKHQWKRPGQNEIFDPVFICSGSTVSPKKFRFVEWRLLVLFKIGKNQERQSKNGLFYRLTLYFIKKEITFWVISICLVRSRTAWLIICNKYMRWLYAIVICAITLQNTHYGGLSTKMAVLVDASRKLKLRKPNNGTLSTK